MSYLYEYNTYIYFNNRIRCLSVHPSTKGLEMIVKRRKGQEAYNWEESVGKKKKGKQIQELLSPSYPSRPLILVFLQVLYNMPLQKKNFIWTESLFGFLYWKSRSILWRKLEFTNFKATSQNCIIWVYLIFSNLLIRRFV